MFGHKTMDEKSSVINQEIGACGICCGFCKVFKRVEYRCRGCNWANKMLKLSREDGKGCIFWECVQTKKVECCLICKEFPCQKHYDEKEAIYTKQALDTWERLSKSGLTFGGRRKELESILEKENKHKKKILFSCGFEHLPPFYFYIQFSF